MRFRNVFLALLPLWIFSFSFKFGAGLHYTLLPTFGERILPLWLVGILIGGAAFIQTILDVPAGYLLDRYGYTKLLKIGTLFFLVAALLFVFGLSRWTFILSLLSATIGWLLFSPGVDAYILRTAPKEFIGRYIAMRDMADSAGITAGMGLLALVVSFSVPTLGVIIGGILFVAIIALGYTPKEKEPAQNEQKISKQSYYIRRHFIQHIFCSLNKLNPASSLLLLSGFSGAVFYSIILFVVPILIARAEHTGTLSIGLAIFDIAVLVFGFLLGRLTERWSKRWLVFWGLLLFSTAAFFLGFNFGVLFLVFGFLATTGDEMASISLWAWLDHLDKEHAEDALVSGAINLAQDIGWTVGPIMAGFLFEWVGASWTIATGALLLFITWIIATFRMHLVPHAPRTLPIPLHIPRRRRHKR